MKFRKKPVVIEAFQFTKDVALAALMKELPLPWGLFPRGSWHVESRKLYHASVAIRTLEGVMHADIDDWVIQGVKGELYPCRPDIFEATYEAVE